ncbi:MAG: protein-L-isoaspartate(D-aspartate) O-methyltransferase [Alphaproteobacteria bacterium]|nr:protein-L-isoaspartate(D-aspartate) O-methyltransferase [Alphaproteobacteria bacterium]
MATIDAEAAMCGPESGRPFLSPRVAKAMRLVSRAHFVLPTHVDLAYVDCALPIGYRQTISQPFIVALMTDLADIAATDRVLEIGTGSGYQAAILSLLAREVHSVEIVPELAESAARRLQALGYGVAVHHGDGRAGYPAAAPYDAIIVTAASWDVPPALVAQLREGGRLVVPLGHEHESQRLMRCVKRADGSLEQRACLAVRFVPLVHGEPPPATGPAPARSSTA